MNALLQLNKINKVNDLEIRTGSLGASLGLPGTLLPSDFSGAQKETSWQCNGNRVFAEPLYYAVGSNNNYCPIDHYAGGTARTFCSQMLFENAVSCSVCSHTAATPSLTSSRLQPTLFQMLLFVYCERL